MMTRLTKSQALDHWHDLPAQDITMPEPIAYKHSGSTYGADGIRIEGSRPFIDGILSQLKPLLAAENRSTRLALNYQQVESRPDKPSPFAGQWVCYVKVHQRGDEAQAVNAFASAVGFKGIASAGY